MAKLHITSLGCPKNRVDAEHMLGVALMEGHELVESAEQADALIVNTCSFINEAKKESIDTILRMAQVKEQANHQKKLIVTGCLAQRYADQLEKELPEVDHFLGTSDYTKVASLLKPVFTEQLGTKSPMGQFVPVTKLIKGDQSQRNLVSKHLDYLAKFDVPRVNTTSSFSSYLRISEGCDNACTFCIIPKLRGKQRSRAIEDLVKEATGLVGQGIFELNLIGQDLTAYGHDLPGRPKLSMLLEALAQIKGLAWIRQLYAYPRSFSEDYFRAFEHKNVIPYIDMPVQHGSSRILKAMQRGGGRARMTEIIHSLKKNIPHLVLRSTVIVGFPGETEDDFLELCDFIQEVEFERLGVFRYSNEEDTKAYELPDQLPEKIKEDRYHRLMQIQQEVSRSKMERLIGSIQEAVVEGPSEEHEWLVRGRLWSQAPDIDGLTYLSSNEPLRRGDRVMVKITDAHDYDLAGEVVEHLKLV